MDWKNLVVHEVHSTDSENDCVSKLMALIIFSGGGGGGNIEVYKGNSRLRRVLNDIFIKNNSISHKSLFLWIYPFLSILM